MKLLALRCPQCNEQLVPTDDEAVIVGCRQCFTAVSLHQTGLHPLPLQYATPAKQAPLVWLPMWVFHGLVRITDRTSQGGARGEDKKAAEFWQSERRLYVPAWRTPPGAVRELGSQLIQAQPQFQPLSTHPDKAAIQDVIFDQAAALKLLDFIIISMEAQRKDMLQKVSFEIRTRQVDLWAVPAQKTATDFYLLPTL
jgi:hypothetical protein